MVRRMWSLRDFRFDERIGAAEVHVFGGGLDGSELMTCDEGVAMATPAEAGLHRRERAHLSRSPGDVVPARSGELQRLVLRDGVMAPEDSARQAITWLTVGDVAGG